MDLPTSAPHIDPGDSPASLPFKWRVLYEIVRIHIGGRSSEAVLERWLLHELMPVLGIQPPKGLHTPDELVRVVDSAARAELHDALEELRITWFIERRFPISATGEWDVIPTVRGTRTVRDWYDIWLCRLKELSSQPTGWKAYIRELLAAKQMAPIVAALVGAAVSALLTYALVH